MEAVARKVSWLSQPLRFGLAIAGTVVVWLIAPGGPLYTVLLVVICMLLLAFKRHVWALAAYLVAQLTITSYMVALPVGPAISLRLLLLLLALIIVWPNLARKKTDAGLGAKAVLMPVLLLTGVSLVANLTGSGMGFAFKDLRSMMVGVLTILLIPAVVTKPKDLKLLCGVMLITLAVSAAVGILQRFGTFGMDSRTLVLGFIQRNAESIRVPGATESFLNLSFALSAILPAIVAVYFLNGFKGGRTVLLVSLFLMGPALYFTYTRSTYLAVGLGLASLLIFARTKLKPGLVLPAILILVLALELSGALGSQVLGGRSAESQDTSSLSRKVLWQAGLAIAQDNPILGIGGDQFTTVSPMYASRVDPALMAREEQYWSYRDLGTLEPHNDFLSMTVSYGFVALVAYLWLALATLRNFLDSYRSSISPFLRGLSVGLAAGLVTYLVNAFYHNMVATFPLFWMLAGLSAATAKLALRRSAQPLALRVAHWHGPGQALGNS